MKGLSAIVLGVLLSASTLFANLGDTTKDAMRRYGAGWSGQIEAAANCTENYSIPGWKITQIYDQNGKAEAIIYLKMRHDAASPLSISAEEWRAWQKTNIPNTAKFNAAPDRGRYFSRLWRSLDNQWVIMDLTLVPNGFTLPMEILVFATDAGYHDLVKMAANLFMVNSRLDRNLPLSEPQVLPAAGRIVS